MHVIAAETVDRVMDWPRVVGAIAAGHCRPKPQTGDVYFTDAGNGMLSRSAWISGLGSCVKVATIFPPNVDRMPPLASIQGSVLLFDPETGETRAVVDGGAVTRWKTAGDSALGSQILSRTDSRTLLMVGAGTQAAPLIRAHVSVRPSIERVAIWNRSPARAQVLAASLADLGRPVVVASDLEAEVRAADIVSVATMSMGPEPVVRGAWLKPGAHLDLVGAYTTDMRETDDEAMRRGKVFVDYRGSTIGHIGEITIPIRTGVIREQDVFGDLYDLVPGKVGRASAGEITLFKNGGGAHLDLMTTLAIYEAVQAQASA